MPEYYPLLIVGGIIGAISTLFIAAYAAVKCRDRATPSGRIMSDGHGGYVQHIYEGSEYAEHEHLLQLCRP